MLNLKYELDAGNFGGQLLYMNLCLACDCQIKIRKYFILAYIRMAIPYQAAKFKIRQYFYNDDLGPNRQI